MNPRLLPLAAIALASCAGPRHDHADAAHSHHPSVQHTADKRTVDFPGHQMRVLLDARTLEGDLAVFEITVPPRTLGAPPHRHRNEDESFYVLEGELVFLSDNEEVRTGPGTVANLPRGHVHGFWNASDTPARALLTISPARFGSFFDEVAAELRTRGATDPRAIGALLTEVAARYDCEVYRDRIGPIAERYGLR